MKKQGDRKKYYDDLQLQLLICSSDDIPSKKRAKGNVACSISKTNMMETHIHAWKTIQSLRRPTTLNKEHK